MNVEAKNGTPVPMDGDRDSADITEHSEPLDSGREKSNGDVKAEHRKAANAKDPSRPRRKKARRACFACQRAHLTCGKHDRQKLARNNCLANILICQATSDHVNAVLSGVYKMLVMTVSVKRPSICTMLRTEH
jgi:hypothetical protein